MTTETLFHVQTRWIIRRDMARVLDIEQMSFSCPWNEDDFLRFLRQRNAIGKVAEHGETVVGFMFYELRKGDGELFLANFAVHPAYRRMGIGAAMASKLGDKLSFHRYQRITLEIRETNLAAQMFFRAQGFKAIGVERGFYEDTDEDAFRFELRRTF